MVLASEEESQIMEIINRTKKHSRLGHNGTLDTDIREREMHKIGPYSMPMPEALQAKN